MRYDPHATAPVVPENLEQILVSLWHDFALAVKNSQSGDTHTGSSWRTHFGAGARVEKLAELFHQPQAVPGQVQDPLEPFASLGSRAGYDEDADEWLDKRLARHGWSLTGVWAATRHLDFRHEGCRACA